MADATIAIKIGAYVKVKDTDKDNCKKIVNIFFNAKTGNNKFEGYVKDIMVEAKFESNIEVKTNDFRMTFMNDCNNAGFGFHAIDPCKEMESYKFYLFANYGEVTVGKNLFDKSLDNDSAFNELTNFLN